MKIRWNWGTGIFVASVAFMLMIVIFVIFMFRQNFDLVENDYYPKALEYQQKIDKTENSRLLAERVKTEKVNGTLFFTFPSFFYSDSISGTIYFYRPSEKKGDVTIIIKPDSTGAMRFNTENLLPGKYMIKIDFKYGKKGYYQEEALLVP